MVAALQLGVQPLGDPSVAARRHRLWPVDHDRVASVAAQHDVGIERDRTEEGHTQLGAHLLTAAMAEHIGVGGTVRAGERAHVLDDPQDRDVHRLEHPQASPGDLEADVLWGGDDDGARKAQALCQRQLSVTSAGRQVEDEVVELAPGDLSDQHLEVLRHHRPAQDGGVVVVAEQPHGHRLDAMAFTGHHTSVLGTEWSAGEREAEHAGHAGPVQVGVDETHAQTTTGQRDRQVDSHRRLADAALTTGHRDDVVDTRKFVASDRADRRSLVGQGDGLRRRRHGVSPSR